MISVSGTFFGGKPLSKTTFGSLAPLAMAEAARGALFPMAGEEIQGMSQLKELRQKMSYTVDELSGKWLAASVHFAVCAAFCRRITQTNHGTTIIYVAGEQRALRKGYFHISTSSGFHGQGMSLTCSQNLRTFPDASGPTV